MATTPASNPVSQEEPAPTSCTLCLEPGASQCQRCGTPYCSRKCQVDDYPVHKLVCKSVSELGDRPSKDHICALVFPQNKDTPEATWIRRTGPGQHVLLDHSCLESVHKKRLDEQIDTRLEVGGGRTVIIFGASREEDGPDLLNRCMLRLAGKPGQSQFYFGPIFAMATIKASEDKADDGVDINPHDFRRVVDLFREAGCNPCVPNEHIKRHPMACIPALKLNDKLLHAMLGHHGISIPGAEKVHVSLGFVDKKTLPSAFAFQLGLRWYFRTAHTCEASLVREKNLQSIAAADSNISQDARFIRRYLRISYSDSGTPLRSQFLVTKNCGPVVVVHSAGAIVEYAHILAFNQYLSLKLKKGEEPVEHEFRQFWDIYKCNGEESVMKDMPSPYEAQETSGATVIHANQDDEDNPNRMMIALNVIRSYKMPWSWEDGSKVPRAD